MHSKRSSERALILQLPVGLCVLCSAILLCAGVASFTIQQPHPRRELLQSEDIDSARRLIRTPPESTITPIHIAQSSEVGLAVAMSLQTRRMVTETLLLQNSPLEPSDSCKSNENEVLELCKTTTLDIDALCDAQQSELATSEYNRLPADTVGPRCKTLWFAGFHMGDASKCHGQGGGYRAEYAALLSTQLVNAPDTLQPVLVMAWQGIDNSTDREHMTRWAERRGVIVLNIDKFSFQDKFDRRNGGNGGDLPLGLGAFIRLDIPYLVEQNGLFDLPDICQPEVLYTDSDVLFMNRVSAEDMQYVKRAVSHSTEATVAYGPERGFYADRIANTGVMIMHVHRFREEWPRILEWALAEPEFPTQDQVLLNGYFKQKGKGLRSKAATLPMLWNWKAYWPVPEGSWPAVKLVHMHGPKPMTGLWGMAECNMTQIAGLRNSYQELVHRGLCCNQGSVAAKVKGIVETLMKYETVCGAQ